MGRPQESWPKVTGNSRIQKSHVFKKGTSIKWSVIRSLRIINSGVESSAEMLHRHFVMHSYALSTMKVIHFGKVLPCSNITSLKGQKLWPEDL